MDVSYFITIKAPTSGLKPTIVNTKLIIEEYITLQLYSFRTFSRIIKIVTR